MSEQITDPFEKIITSYGPVKNTNGYEVPEMLDDQELAEQTEQARKEKLDNAIDEATDKNFIAWSQANNVEIKLSDLKNPANAKFYQKENEDVR